MVGLKTRREAKRLTQLDIATALSVSQQAVAKWETDAALPRADKLPELARILGCTVDELLSDQEVRADAKAQGA